MKVNSAFYGSVSAFLTWVALNHSAVGQGIVSNGFGELMRYPRVYALVDPCDPRAGDTLVFGQGYWAEVWYALGVTSDSNQLLPLPLTQSTISGSNGLMLWPEMRVIIPGTAGGDLVTLQIRVWENAAGLVNSWEDALAHPEIPSGASPLIQYELAGFRLDGSPTFGSGSLWKLQPTFTISAVCPEPSAYVLLGLAGGLVWWIKKR